MVIDMSPCILLLKTNGYSRITIRKTQEKGRRNGLASIKKKKEGGLTKKKEPDSRKRVLLCVNASLEKKAKDLVILNVKEISAFADYFIICSGTSDRQVRAIADAIQENLKTGGDPAPGRRGGSRGAMDPPGLRRCDHPHLPRNRPDLL